MSSSDSNITFKKTSFLSGINSEFINQFYSDYLSDPSSLPESWKRFFEGLSEDEKLILKDLNGPSWSPEKKIKKISNLSVRSEKTEISEEEKLGTIKEASKDAGGLGYPFIPLLKTAIPISGILLFIQGFFIAYKSIGANDND